MLSYIVPVVPTTSLVHACNSSYTGNFSLINSADTTTKLHELNTALDASRGGWRRKQRASTDAVGLGLGGGLVACEGQISRHSRLVYTNKPTSKVKITILHNPTLWANVLGFFSQAPAGRRPIRKPRDALPRASVPHY